MREGIKAPNDDGIFDAPKPGDDDEKAPEPTPVEPQEPSGAPAGWTVAKNISVEVPAGLFDISQSLQAGAKFEFDNTAFKVWNHYYKGAYINVPVPNDFSFMATGLGTAATMMSAAKSKWLSTQVFDEGTGTWVPKHPNHLWMHLIKQAILHAHNNGYGAGDAFEFDGTEWMVHGEGDKITVVAPAHPEYYGKTHTTVLPKCLAAFNTWGSVLNPSPEVPKAPSLTQEWLWGAFEQWKALGSKHEDFIYDGINWMCGTYSVSGGGMGDGPVPIHYHNIPGAPHLVTKANDIVAKAFQEWKASKQPGINLNAITTTPNWTAGITTSGNTATYATYATAAPPFPGKKFPKWGPATGKFENALQQALKTRLGPYATDSMVKEVTKDMLPVLKEYWDEVNAALVSLKMTAAEQDKDVPTQMPGWTPSEVQKQIDLAEKVVPASALKVESPTVGATKVESATAIWKSALSPYLKKQYTQKIEFGKAVGALDGETTLDTPYIDLWIMTLKKHTKKGEPAADADYHAATHEWQKALEGIAA